MEPHSGTSPWSPDWDPNCSWQSSTWGLHIGTLHWGPPSIHKGATRGPHWNPITNTTLEPCIGDYPLPTREPLEAPTGAPQGTPHWSPTAEPRIAHRTTQGFDYVGAVSLIVTQERKTPVPSKVHFRVYSRVSTRAHSQAYNGIHMNPQCNTQCNTQVGLLGLRVGAANWEPKLQPPQPHIGVHTRAPHWSPTVEPYSETSHWG